MLSVKLSQSVTGQGGHEGGGDGGGGEGGGDGGGGDGGGHAIAASAVRHLPTEPSPDTAVGSWMHQ